MLCFAVPKYCIGLCTINANNSNTKTLVLFFEINRYTILFHTHMHTYIRIHTVMYWPHLHKYIRGLVPRKVRCQFFASVSKWSSSRSRVAGFDNESTDDDGGAKKGFPTRYGRSFFFAKRMKTCIRWDIVEPVHCRCNAEYSSRWRWRWRWVPVESGLPRNLFSHELIRRRTNDPISSVVNFRPNDFDDRVYIL